MEAYLRSCRDTLTTHSMVPSELHVVMGNEACDVDSMVSSLAFAYFLSKTLDPGRVVVPVLNIGWAEFPLRMDSSLLLREAGLDPALLMFRDQLDLQHLQTHTHLHITLVDHNVLPSADAPLESSVVEVIDHHRFERPCPSSCSVTVETVGSCATLVTERIVQKAPEVLDQQVALLLYGAIVLDCVNMAPEAGKVTPKDSQYARLLEARFPKLPPRGALFQSLQNAKFDVSGLSTEQMLLKDMKAASGADLRLAVSVIYMTLEAFLQRRSLQHELNEFCHKHNYNLLVAMTISFNTNSEPFRQLAVYSASSVYRQEVSRALEKGRNPSLALSPMSSPHADITAYYQGNAVASRKKILPIITDFLRDWEGRAVNAGNTEGLEGEEVEPRQGGAAEEDCGMEEECGVPPTPMNSLVEGCPLDYGLPPLSAADLQERVSRMSSRH